jgi:glycosyltransferase involved in cell wall biosynthesis
LSLNGAFQTDPGDSGALRTPHVACRISVIVPTRNRPALLGRALARMRSQQFSAYEVIVVDDSSNVQTRAAYTGLWETLDARFVLIELGRPGGPGVGPSVARNTGIEAASGAIITFCDDDDFWTSDEHLEAMVEAFDADPQIDLYIANQSAVTCDGRLERPDWLPALVGQVRGKPRSHARGYHLGLDELLRSGGFAQLNIVAVSAATARAVGGFWTRISYEEDRDFFWRVADAARAIFFNPDVVAQHNVPDPSRQDNLSRNFSQTERWMISALVSQHIALSVRSPLIRTMCQSYEGDILRKLSQSLSSEGRHALGLQYARRALAARMSLKWALYTIVLAGRQLLRRGTA